LQHRIDPLNVHGALSSNHSRRDDLSLVKDSLTKDILVDGMDDVNVLVVFYSRAGLTERLAVLLAEGAIQAGAKIRLRRSRDLMPEELIAVD
jgi:hypothetical protein